MIIDTHAHMNSERYEVDRKEIIENFSKDNVIKIISVSYNFESSKENLQLANTYDSVYASFGIHPHDSDKYNVEFENFVKLNATNKKVVAIGEIGLDYYKNEISKEIQKETFVKQLKLANELNLPIIIHVRDSYGDTLEVLKQNKHLLNNSGVVHCFSGSLEFANEIFKLGLVISFGGVITFKNSKLGQEVAKNLSLDKILVETDCPYLTPHPFRGTRNQPKYTNLVVEKLAEIFKKDVKELEEIFNQNAYLVFKKLK